MEYKMILASNSPRRRELLSGLGLDYVVRTLPDVDESYPEVLKGEEIPLYIARQKADANRALLAADELVITADTIVWLDGKVLGKPTGTEDACRMLRELSGRKHQVFTGVCLSTSSWQHAFACGTDVSFAPLEEEEIRFHVDNFRPFDKAGSYGVQEWIGYIGCTGLNGSYFNVMGLPVQRLYTELRKLAKEKDITFKRNQLP